MVDWRPDRVTTPTTPNDGPPPTPNASWRPPRRRESNTAAIVVGLLFVAIGGWYFLEQTLGIEMPRIAWRDIWPVLLIVLGVVIVVRSMDRRARP
jgi:hypothetical protein